MANSGSSVSATGQDGEEKTATEILDQLGEPIGGLVIDNEKLEIGLTSEAPYAPRYCVREAAATALVRGSQIEGIDALCREHESPTPTPINPEDLRKLLSIERP